MMACLVRNVEVLRPLLRMSGRYAVSTLYNEIRQGLNNGRRLKDRYMYGECIHIP